MVAAPGGPILDARGSLVSSDALTMALREERIAGAGLDVIEGEPAVPDGFRELDRLVLSPHVGGFSPEAIRTMIHRVRDNLDAHFAGKPVPTPIPA
jgi:lactate dehydrogenase-like 2-hydroxyacid dehydrogenase